MMPEKIEKTIEEQLKAVMAVHNWAIIDRVAKNRNITNAEAIDSFYNSNLYDLYENENTKLWHFSYVTIANLLTQELDTGSIDFPVEG